MLSKTQIKNLATSTQVYFRGTDYALEGRVRILEEESGGNLPHTASAVITGGSGRAYSSFVELSEDENCLLASSCTCPAFAQYEGLCKHLVALLIVLQESACEPDPFSPRGALLSRRSAGHPPDTDRAALMVMREYAKKAAAQAAFPQGELVRIEPLLEIDSAPLRLSFQIGISRMYVVRNLVEFQEAAAMGAEYSYGKALTFPHRLQFFHPDSRPLYRFMLAHTPQPSYFSATDWRRYLLLTPHILDEFFSLYPPQEDITPQEDMDIAPESGRMLPVLLKDTLLQCSVRKGNPKLHLWIRRLKSGSFRLSLREEIQLLSGLENLYLLQGETLWQCSRDFRESCEALLAALGKNHGNLNLAQKDLQVFYVHVLSRISPYILLDTRLNLSECIPPPLSAEIYLDQSSPGAVTARVKFCYGEQSYDAFSPRSFLEARDISRETQLEELLKSYFPPPDPKTGVLTLRQEEDLYRLVSEGIPQLNELAKVYAADSFRNLRVQAHPTVQVGVRINSGLMDLDFQLEGVALEELADVLRSYRSAKRYHRLRSGAFLNLEDPGLEEFSQLAEGLNLGKKELAQGRASLPEYRTLYLDNLLQQSSRLQYSRDEMFCRIAREIKEAPRRDLPIPASLKGVLRPYQETGYRWLRTLAGWGFSGLLADDMGLGKTLQVLTLLVARKDDPDTGEGLLPSLVVCPASLVLNWASEVRKFAPGLRVSAVQGSAAQRRQILSTAKEADLIITSYDQLKRDIELYQEMTFDYEILDEAQAIKNPSTQNARAVKLIKSRTRFALTGTPMENSLADLWSIYDYLMPGYLFSYHKFRQILETPIVREQEVSASQRLKKLVAPFLLRRMKKDVLEELPEKVETVLYSVMMPEQRKLYLANALSARAQIAAEGAQKKLTVLSLLTRLRQICCDPALIYEDYRGQSGKLSQCMELIETCLESGHKVLLFSQFTSMLARIAHVLGERNIGFYELTGATPASERLSMVNAFNQDKTPVFLISLKAGGTGLNLTGADVVIHYDPWWNLSAQNQATDRAHRIGQRSSVQVYQLIAKDSIEEKILTMQEAKSRLSEDILESDAALLSGMSQQELLSLFDAGP